MLYLYIRVYPVFQPLKTGKGDGSGEGVAEGCSGGVACLPDLAAAGALVAVSSSGGVA